MGEERRSRVTPVGEERENWGSPNNSNDWSICSSLRVKQKEGREKRGRRCDDDVI
jgi:hypothetical protein